MLVALVCPRCALDVPQSAMLGRRFELRLGSSGGPSLLHASVGLRTIGCYAAGSSIHAKMPGMTTAPNP